MIRTDFTPEIATLKAGLLATSLGSVANSISRLSENPSPSESPTCGLVPTSTASTNTSVLVSTPSSNPSPSLSASCGYPGGRKYGRKVGDRVNVRGSGRNPQKDPHWGRNERATPVQRDVYYMDAIADQSREGEPDTGAQDAAFSQSSTQERLARRAPVPLALPTPLPSFATYVLFGDSLVI